MVKLYTWGPTTPETVLGNTIAPDIGHAALEVIPEDTRPGTYVSFWPERDSLIGRVTSLWKKRPVRNPTSYAQEIAPDDGFMQRPADQEDQIAGLDEGVIADLWQKLQKSEYDFLKWNCASVCKLLILSALPARLHPALQEVMGALPAHLAQIGRVEDLQAALHELASSPFIDSHPEELRKIAEAYLAATRG